MSTTATLMPTDQKLAKAVVRDGLAFTFITNIDYMIVAALLPVAVLHGGTVGASVFSMAVSIRVIASIVGMLCAPAVFSRARSGQILMMASVLKGLAFAVICTSISLPAMCLFAVLAGLGTGIAKPAIRALLSNAATADSRAKVFQLFFVMMNAAFVVGPFVARAALTLDSSQMFLVVLAGIETLAGLWILRATRAVDAVVPTGQPFDIARVIGLWLNVRVVPILLLSFMSYFAMGFILTGFLLYQNIMPGLGAYREVLLSFEALAMIVIQLLMMPVFKKISRLMIYVLGTIGVGAGLLLSFSSVLPIVACGLVLFAVAECLLMPQSQLEVSRSVPASETAAVFSAVTLAGAIGEAFGSLMVGYVIESGTRYFPSVGVAAQSVAVPVLLAFVLTSVLALRSGVSDLPAEAAERAKS